MSTSADNRPVAIVVDDEPEIRRLIGRTATDAGFTVVEAENGLRLLECLDQVSPTIIILDLQMSAADGVETIRGLAARGVTAEIFLCSGADIRTLESTRDVAVRQGLKIAGLLQKPVRRAELLQKLSHAALEQATFSSETLRRCLDKQLINVHYQPKLSLSSLSIVGVEALLRCQDEIGRFIPPNEVIDVAEAGGLIDEVTETVFRQALGQRRIWSEAGLDLNLAVNLSPRCSFDRQLPELLASLCKQAQVPETAVTIELTETAVMNDEIMGMEALIRLRLKGFRLSVDDFGTGYSSLIRLKQLPFSEIKIDKSFVTKFRETRDNIAIVTSIIHLAHGMELHCVIEGVETQDALAFAAAKGCNDAQGYFIARPMVGHEVPGFMKTWQWRQEALRGLAGQAELGEPSEADKSNGGAA